MTINSAIERYGEAARAGLSLRVALDDARGIWIRLVATPAALEFLGHLVSGLNEDDCYHHLEPFGAGSAYFQRTRNSTPGLYLHRRPCHSEIRLFPEERGIRWLCFAGSFRGRASDERDHDPSFIVIDGDANALLWLKEKFLRVASEGRCLVLGAEELQAVFGPVAAFGFEIVPIEDFAAGDPD